MQLKKQVQRHHVSCSVLSTVLSALSDVEKCSVNTESEEGKAKASPGDLKNISKGGPDLPNSKTFYEAQIMALAVGTGQHSGTQALE